MKIAISGKPGSGKSTVGRLLSEKLGYQFFSVGDLRGQMAQKRGLTVDQFNALADRDPRVHTDADEYARRFGQENDNFILDGWLSYWTVPDAFKIFLDLDIAIAAERIFNDQKNRPDEKHYESVAEVHKTLEDRIEMMRTDWLRLYGTDWTAPANYDLIIDTSHVPIAAVVDEILETIRRKERQENS